MTKVAVGLFGLHTWNNGDPREHIRAAQIAEDKGIDQVVVVDHVAMSDALDLYPYGSIPGWNLLDWYEPISLLSAIAGATQRIRLSSGIIISPLRPAVLFAKQVATLDALSRGRVDLGVGVGWQRPEYDYLGVPWDGRFGRLIEQIKVCRELWTGEAITFHGNTVDLEGAYCRPVPAQGRNVPVWFGLAPSPRNIERIAEVGDGWIPDPQFEDKPKEVGQKIKALRAAFVEHGRDPAELTVRLTAQPVMRPDGSADLS